MRKKISILKKKLKRMMKTVNDLYLNGVRLLERARVEDAAFDARVLMEHLLETNSTGFLLSRNDTVSEKQIEIYVELIQKRSDGMPLQYIVGKWEFMGNEFYVGEGVLIPRPETEQLVEAACEYLTDIENPMIVDFCSGTGCIAISIAKIFTNAKVYAVEKYDEAFSYLVKNIELNNVRNVVPIQGDMFDKTVIKDVVPDIILSNPPYIRKGDISSLQTEVLKEPVTALDGGADGYDFYRFLCEYWFAEFLHEDTAMMVECAEDQGDYISEMLSVYSRKTEIIRDFNGLQRIVAAYK